MRTESRALVILSVLLVVAARGLQSRAQSDSSGTWQSGTADKAATEMTGVWRHFGDDREASAPVPPLGEGWHHFGETVNPAPRPPQFATRRGFAATGTQTLEQEMFELVNRDRSDPANRAETGGRALPLRWNDQLADVARAHSLEMMTHGYFGHIDSHGGSVASRVETAGMEWGAVGENIAIYDSIQGAQAGFMNEPRFSKNHRANILSSNYTDVGIGIVQAPNGALYITQDFYAGVSPAGSQ